jgi:hypothetical protein
MPLLKVAVRAETSTAAAKNRIAAAADQAVTTTPARIGATIEALPQRRCR